MAGGAIAGAALGSAVGGFFAARAAKSAARSQRKAAESGIAEQRRQFDVTQEQFAPFQEAGVGALREQQALLGLGSQEENQAALAGLAETPGQRFLRDQQERSLLRNTAAIGGLGGGNVRSALQEQAFGRAQTDFSNRFNRLGSLAGGGQAATTNLGQFRGGTASNIANLQSQAGAARASGILGQQQAFGQTIGGLTSLAAQAGAFSPTPQPRTFTA